MRRLLILAAIPALASCSTIKKASAPSEQGTRVIASSKSSPSKSDPVFIENISFKPGSEKKTSGTVNIEKAPVKESSVKGPNIDNTPAAIELLPSLRFKYAILLNAPVEDLMDDRLLSFMDEWYGTRYRLGGTNKSGIDCSALVQLFFAAIYGIEVPRTCREQYLDSRRISMKQLQEGDLVFFKTRGKSISHVGIYLRNNKFIHASTSSGVMISDLSEDYFERRYAGAGRVKDGEK